MSDKHCLFAVADADPARSICETFRAEFNAARKAQFEWVKEKAPHATEVALKQGLTSRIGIYHADLDRKLWTNPDKNGCQWPRSTAKELTKEMGGLSPLPGGEVLAKRLGVITNLNYQRGAQVRGGGAIGPLSMAFTGGVTPFWGGAQGRILMKMVDAAAAAADHLKEHPEDTITTPGAVDWKPMEGLRVISEDEAMSIYYADKAASAEQAA